MYRLTYGLFVLTARENNRDNGCITNTAIQVTSDPVRLTIAVNKSNYTHDMIFRTKKFNLSMLSEDADFPIFERFGYQSGRDADKFGDFSDYTRSENGLVYLTKGTNAFLSGEVEQTFDLGTHTLFIAKVTDMEVLSAADSMSYFYYQDHVKPKPNKAKDTDGNQTVWRCKICGYEYVGDEMPEDFVCPICKHPASDFEKVE